MFETIFESINVIETMNASMDIEKTLLSIVVALVLGLLISAVYMIITPTQERSCNFVMALVILPVLISVVILLVGNSVARAFSIAGVFTLIRFRSVPGDSKDITFVFLCMILGLTTGLGYISFGVIVTVLVSVVIVLIKKSNYGVVKSEEKRLKIVIPEDMNFQNVFDEVLEKYTDHAKMMKVKTTNLGTLYEISYDIVMKRDASEKEFMDELRCRNGNLTVQLMIKENIDNRL